MHSWKFLDPEHEESSAKSRTNETCKNLETSHKQTDRQRKKKEKTRKGNREQIMTGSENTPSDTLMNKKKDNHVRETNFPATECSNRTIRFIYNCKSVRAKKRGNTQWNGSLRYECEHSVSPLWRCIFIHVTVVAAIFLFLNSRRFKCCDLRRLKNKAHNKLAIKLMQADFLANVWSIPMFCSMHMIPLHSIIICMIVNFSDKN